MIQQGTEEWLAQRHGRVTASRVADVMARTRSGPAAARKNYMMELLCQRLTGQREDGFVSTAMARMITAWLWAPLFPPIDATTGM